MKIADHVRNIQRTVVRIFETPIDGALTKDPTFIAERRFEDVLEELNLPFPFATEVAFAVEAVKGLR